MDDYQRISTAVSKWKKKLLDLTGNNRALNFLKDGKSGFRNRGQIVRFPGADQTEVFYKLVVSREKLSVLPGLKVFTGNLFEVGEKVGFPFTKAGISSQKDTQKIQSDVPPEKFDKFFRQMAGQALSSIEEKGVNVLYLALGLLTFENPRNLKEKLTAPLVLLPVTIQPGRAGNTVLLEAIDEDPVVNPALVEFLKVYFHFVLPDFDFSDEAVESGEFEKFWKSLEETVCGKPGWKLDQGVFLAFFSFEKLVLYKDLEKNEASISAHPVIRQIVLRSGQSVQSLPKEILQAELDKEFAPETTAQVVDADASQLRAIMAVSKGHSIVIEGPPGTGKSQTITNLIAQALFEGKKVLFVAEKQAALDVVSARLANAGLGEFCLDVHAKKAAKSSVLEQIRTSIDASTRLPSEPASSHRQLKAVRDRLTSYIRAVHQPVAPLGFTPHRAIGELEKVRQAPRVPFALPVEAVSREVFEDTERELREFVAVAERVREPRSHPWRDTKRTFYTVEDLESIEECLIRALNALEVVIRLSRQASQMLGVPMVQQYAEVKGLTDLAEIIERSPGAPGDVLRSSVWNAPPPEATELIRLGRTVYSSEVELSRKFRSETLEDFNHEDDIRFMEEKLSATLSFLNIFNGRFRAIRKKWVGYRLAGYQASLLDLLGDMKSVVRYQKERERLRQSEGTGRSLFGHFWKGSRSDWSRLDSYVKWVVEFRKLCVEKSLPDNAIALAEQAAPELTAIKDLKTASGRFEAQLTEFAKEVQWDSSDLLGAPIEDLRSRLSEFQQSISEATTWGDFERVRRRAEKSLAAEIVARAMTGEFPVSQTVQVFRRAVLLKWLKGVIQSKPELEAFGTVVHEQARSEFKILDRSTLVENRTRLIRMLRNRVQQGVQDQIGDQGMVFLRDQLGRQRKHKPLRTIFHRAFKQIQTAKPVFLMSPTTVAQFIEPVAGSFDLVIFDEASQLPTEDAVGAIFRGKQLVVVGDPKQLPPTNFFAATLGVTDAETDEDENLIFEDGESILEEFMSSGAPMSRLKWHYRSLDESLIQFSNINFYEGQLHTFPSVQTKSPDWGLCFEYVSDGLYSGKGLNLPEARRVVEAVFDHVRNFPHLSSGIGTFSLRQKEAIDELISEKLGAEKELAPFFDKSREDHCFVKNLESIQGDERDVIFLSVTYGRNESGVIRYNFGPINQNNGNRRLNVLASRARRKMVVFSSIRADEMDRNKLNSAGPQNLRKFLEYAETGRFDGKEASGSVVFDSPFEEEVYEALKRSGLNLMTQIGDSGYRIDIGVLDDEFPGRFLCGIECDGASYHSSQTARDRDRLRQEVLEDRNWIIHRVWSTDWFRDPESQVNRLLQLIQETKQKVRQKELEDSLPTAETSGEFDVVEFEETEEPEPVETDLDGLKTPYIRYRPRNWYLSLDFHESGTELISTAILDVVEVEAPIHFKELSSRVAERWGLKTAGQAVQRRIQSILGQLEQSGKLRQKGDFVHHFDLSRPALIRDRAGLNIKADRIPPEEYDQAILAVLEAKPLLDRKELAAQVRALFGFSRTGQVLDALIQNQVSELLKSGRLAEGSTGLRMRKIETSE